MSEFVSSDSVLCDSFPYEPQQYPPMILLLIMYFFNAPTQLNR